MPKESHIDWRTTLGIAVPALALAAGAYVRFGIVQTLRDDAGFERNVRRWTPIATEFRMHHVGLARSIIRASQGAQRLRLVSPARQQLLEAEALKLVRCESRPVYSSGRRGKWGDTGARWQLDGATERLSS